jgi:hypothetical protein
MLRHRDKKSKLAEMTALSKSKASRAFQIGYLLLPGRQSRRKSKGEMAVTIIPIYHVSPPCNDFNDSWLTLYQSKAQ